MAARDHPPLRRHAAAAHHVLPPAPLGNRLRRMPPNDGLKLASREFDKGRYSGRDLLTAGQYHIVIGTRALLARNRPLTLTSSRPPGPCKVHVTRPGCPEAVRQSCRPSSCKVAGF